MRNLLKFNSFGFTIIELLIAFSVIAILSMVSIASYNNYSNNQKLTQATADFVNALNTAKSKAYAQSVPVGCNGGFKGYVLEVQSAKTYAVRAVCQTSTLTVTSVTISDSVVSISTPNSFPQSIIFEAITGGVGNGSITTVVLSGYGQTKTVNISSTGAISVN